MFAVLAVLVILTTWLLRPRLFAVASDEEYARAMGMPVLALNIALAVLTAVTVVVSMRIVGLLLISALMIVPVAAAQLIGSSFRATMRWAVVIGLVCSVGGVVVSYEADTPSGGTIVVLAILVFVAASVGRRCGHPGPARSSTSGPRSTRTSTGPHAATRRWHTTATWTTSTTATATHRTRVTTTSTTGFTPPRASRPTRPGPRRRRRRASRDGTDRASSPAHPAAGGRG